MAPLTVLLMAMVAMVVLTLDSVAFRALVNFVPKEGVLFRDFLLFLSDLASLVSSPMMLAMALSKKPGSGVSSFFFSSLTFLPLVSFASSSMREFLAGTGDRGGMAGRVKMFINLKGLALLGGLLSISVGVGTTGMRFLPPTLTCASLTRLMETLVSLMNLIPSGKSEREKMIFPADTSAFWCCDFFFLEKSFFCDCGTVVSMIPSIMHSGVDRRSMKFSMASMSWSIFDGRIQSVEIDG